MDEGDTLGLAALDDRPGACACRRRRAGRVLRRTVSAVVAAVAAVCAPCARAALPRALVDRPDEWPAGTALVHVLYVVPSDGADRALDTNGTLEGSVG